ncbi:hypothetical protein PAUR_a1686 [Pseudoalteromonas aurantia 208]|uniref:Uncharacterized protein n=1 Tax=Pseudoalteromonas aurantia 208 TaxID=1314867 RepID=A0ABR9ED30_9GAMM|nr:hypothetical protein [Pseudoalteromonas aurantia 208]
MLEIKPLDESVSLMELLATEQSSAAASPHLFETVVVATQ